MLCEAISGLVGRLGMVESKVDVLPAALQKIEAANNIEPLTERLSLLMEFGLVPMDLTKIRSSRTLPPTPIEKPSNTRVAGEFAFDGNI